jgi:YrbI family 3-deoxy-D-manno-octulosonate 8-phosphate phosphatase
MKGRLRKMLGKIRAVAMDVDGVLTDGGMYYTEMGEVMKKFNAKDGMGVSLLQNYGIKVAFITGEALKIAKARAKKLKVKDVYLFARDKLKTLEGFAKKYGLSLKEVAYIGDDLNDIECLKNAGISFAPADANPEAKKFATYGLKKKGGEGAVREVADLIILAKRK